MPLSDAQNVLRLIRETKENVRNEMQKNISDIRVGQVRDNVDVDVTQSRGAFAIVTQITNHKHMTRIKYDLVTDHGIVRDMQLGSVLFSVIYPVIYLDHVTLSPAFRGAYKGI